MQADGAWIAVKNVQPKAIMLKRLQITALTPTLPGDCDLEAEALTAPLHLHAAGSWKQMPLRASNQHSGGFYLQSGTRNSKIYIPIQYANYVTIYRPVSNALGDAEVYIDGEFWGIMPGQGSRIQAQVPFTIGPITDVDPHVIERARPPDQEDRDRPGEVREITLSRRMTSTTSVTMRTTASR